ncbi:Cupredoxin [Protomyces lactucae-debilis]|uniref:Cupredoxin n=1 Tax=Protomyces lactucae-debilis TaxID=2754530 RepID=A0A1Y2FAN0_PROLT|nr:Cupredoxin [Protomyces lactucae-debilis]ORY80958.1 Cupredoxin [Protomyces lactucae-debilis]
MRFTLSLFATALLTPLVQGQQLFEVSVGETDLTFNPDTINAAVGDRVMFVFYPKNHSVVQSTFDKPCVRLPANGSTPAGIFSGYMPTAANASFLSTYTILINDTKPLWFYCSQGTHCKAGMSMVVNPPNSVSVLTFLQS